MFPKGSVKFILINLVIAALIVVLINYILARREINNLKISGGKYNNSDRGLYSRIKSHSININQNLNSETAPQNKAEIAALQLLVNLYNTEKYVEVDGVWSDKLEYAVKDMTGGALSTTLYDMIQVNFSRIAPEEYSTDFLYKFINAQILI